MLKYHRADDLDENFEITNRDKSIAYITNDSQLEEMMDYIIELVEVVDQYLDRRTKDPSCDNYYNRQNVINYQDKLNEYAVKFIDDIQS